MTKVLCVAEKPSIAKAISQALSGGRYDVNNTRDKYVKNYSFDYNFRQWGSCSVTVTSVRGHLYGLDFDNNYHGWGKCDPRILLDITTPCIETVPTGAQAMIDNIRIQSRQSKYLYIWTDCDREGEHIGNEIIKAAQRNKNDPTIKRAVFNNTEFNHLKQAANNPRDMDWNSVDAVQARMEMDLRTGAAYTRLQCSILRAIAGLDRKTISYGSCQFPTLGFVVDRYHKVRNFKKEEFWYIEVKYKKDDKNVLFAWDRGRFYNRLCAISLFERCVLAGSTATVTTVDTKPTSRRKPLPLTTVDLQKQGAKFLHMSSKRVMDVAEQLYNKGYLSYPRTETNKFAPEIDLQRLISKQQNNSRWGDYVDQLQNHDQFSRPRDGNKDDKAHPPIHPVNSIPDSLTTDEKKVYEFVTRHFLACCGKDAQGLQTKVVIDWDDEKFNTSGVVVTQRNFLDVYPYIKWETNQLPEFTPNEQIQLTETLLQEGTTSPPKPLTEPELIGLMDANGIGTDATMAEHISKIQEREYVETTKRGNTVYFTPTALGCGLVDSYDKMDFDMSLTKPFVRKDTEQNLQKICDGELTKQQFIEQSLEVYTNAFDLALRNSNLLKITTQNYMHPNR